MKKWISLILLLVTLLSMAGCTSAGGKNGTQADQVGGMNLNGGATEAEEPELPTSTYIASFLNKDGTCLLRSDGAIEPLAAAESLILFVDGSAAAYLYRSSYWVQRPGGGSKLLFTLKDHGEYFFSYYGNFALAETEEGLYYYPDLERSEGIKIGDYAISTRLISQQGITANVDRSAAFVADEGGMDVLYHIDLDTMKLTKIATAESTSDYGIILNDGISKDYVSYMIYTDNNREDFEWFNPDSAAPQKGYVTSCFNVPIAAEGEAYFYQMDGRSYQLPFVLTTNKDRTYKVSRNEKYVAIQGDGTRLFELTDTEAVQIAGCDVDPEFIKVYDDGTVLLTERGCFGVLSNGTFTQISDLNVSNDRMDYSNGVVYYIEGLEDLGGRLMKYTLATGISEVIYENARELLATPEGCYYVADAEEYLGSLYRGTLYFEGSSEPLMQETSHLKHTPPEP